MNCDRYRAAASARLDGEPLRMSPTTLDAHISGCQECRSYQQHAEKITRLTRLDATPVPDLTDEIVERIVLPTHRVRTRRNRLRVGLLAAGAAQLVIAAPALAGDSVGMHMSMHGAHETAAWNLAIGAAFLAAAWLPRRAAGLIPLLGTFLVVLTALSIRDLIDGAVTLDRLATHVAVLIGFAFLVGLDRAERALAPTPIAQAHPDQDDGPTDLRTVA